MTEIVEFTDKEFRVLKILEDQNLSPLEIARGAKLPIQEAQVAIASLLARDLLRKTSDGFTSILSVTGKGKSFVTQRKTSIAI